MTLVAPDAASMVPDPITVRRLGRVPYADAWALQRALVPRIAAGVEPETLLLLEHPPTYTLGTRGGRDHLRAPAAELTARGAALVETDRGGDITYHGPGQIVGYPLLDLRRRTGGDVHRYLRLLEETLILAAWEFGLRCGREDGLTGVWWGGAKLAAIGVKINRGVSLHGFALNVGTDLAAFDLIVPCGLDRPVTSLEGALGRRVPPEEAVDAVLGGFSAAFGLSDID